MKLKSIIGILLISFIISSCGSNKNKEDAHGEQEEGHGGHDENGKSVSLTKQQIEAINLKLVKLEKRNMNLGVQATGKLELAPQDKADISPILGGVVKSIKVFEGDKVAQGQILATLEHPDFIQLQQDYINNLNSLKYLEKDFARQKKLYEEKVGSGKTFQKTSADYYSSKSTVDGLKIKLRMLGINVKEVEKGKIFPTVNIVAPMRGTVSLVETNVGAFVAPLTKVFEIVNNDKIHADLMVYEKDISKIEIGQTMFFTTTSLADKELEAKIYAISPAFEANPKAIHVHANIISKNKKLLPGMYIKGKIIAKNVEATVLSEHAIVSEEGKSYIFVKKEAEKHAHTEDVENHKDADHEIGEWGFEMVEIIAGFSSDGYVEVKLLNPLPKNAQIAGNGAYYLLAEMGKGETAHSH